MKYFEDIEADYRLEFEYGYKVTEEEIMEVGNRWDPQPFHIDKDAAKKSIFGGLIASSVHLFAIWCAIGMRDGGFQVASVSALGFNNMKTKSPVKAGDILKDRLWVKQLRESKSRPDCGIVEVYHEMFNQNGEVVFTLEVAFLVKRREGTQ